MITCPAPAAVVTREVTTTETRPATLRGCTWVIIPDSEFPDILRFGAPCPWYALRLTGDGRFISGFGAATATAARELAADDQARLLDWEQDHFRRHGVPPEPMTPVLLDPPAPVIAVPPALVTETRVTA